MEEKRYIICIDDEFFILWNLKEQLKKVFGNEYTIETAESAESAKEIIQEINSAGEDIPVVICDQVMPGQKGDEFLIELQATNPNTKKIMLTGQAPAQAVGNALNHGCLYRYLPKPWDASDLELTIKQAIDSFYMDKSLEEKNKELEKSLYFNPETNFPNFESLIKLLADPEKTFDSLSLVLIKITTYPTIIKNFGIEIYRKIISRFLQMLSVHLQAGGTVYHLYEDEIAILSMEKEENLVANVENFRLLLKADDIVLEEVSFHLNCFFSSATGREDAYYKAKLALFQAEGSNSSSFVSYSDELSTDHHLQNFQLSQKIRNAIQNKEIVPFFQGIRDNKTNTFTKFECLARIRDKNGFLAPSVFLDLAKATGSIRLIGLQMIDGSMNYFKDKNYEFSINLTEAELEYKSFSKWVQARLAHYGIDPKRVTFEILEDVSFAENINSVTTIRDLKELGCKIAIDDFGVQYSNLSRLLEIDPDYIKIDGRFIKELPHNKTATLLVKGIVDLAHGIGAKVVAEFVSNEEIQKTIVDMGIEYSQGYLFMEPSEAV
ncbi:EAL domain-containing response regulator [Leptospira idonii]|uniref:EAL domain-containing protein n=1 Tax=Leptospira idonii TaxID=1193500 RepID=A0A4R9LZF5_9LEPT|nr:EAL domain-containing protein [Leptospira idonii]TGN18737.1 EAL domain-containing protein [Leptospira idonii]